MERESDEDPMSESAMHHLGDGIPGKGHSPCKGPEADPACRAGGTETCVAGQSRWARETEGARGQVLQGLVGFNLGTSLESFKAGWHDTLRAVGPNVSIYLEIFWIVCAHSKCEKKMLLLVAADKSTMVAISLFVFCFCFVCVCGSRVLLLKPRTMVISIQYVINLKVLSTVPGTWLSKCSFLGFCRWYYY